MKSDSRSFRLSIVGKIRWCRIFQRDFCQRRSRSFDGEGDQLFLDCRILYRNGYRKLIIILGVSICSHSAVVNRTFGIRFIDGPFHHLRLIGHLRTILIQHLSCESHGLPRLNVVSRCAIRPHDLVVRVADYKERRLERFLANAEICATLHRATSGSYRKSITFYLIRLNNHIFQSLVCDCQSRLTAVCSIRHNRNAIHITGTGDAPVEYIGGGISTACISSQPNLHCIIGTMFPSLGDHDILAIFT